jgi:DNA-binding NtrC family response regulator
MESELFGHAKGAFTGAVGSKRGLIEMADGGTAFFDEIGELPLDLQAKLLRVLQEKEFRPVGTLAPRQCDFRVIAATNRDLAKEVEKGNFRSDLYYRLNVVTIKLAPLRERRDDIRPLLNWFLEKYSTKGHILAAETLDAMLSYEWPGNVRELENCVQQMVAMHSGPVLQVADLPSPIQNHLLAPRGVAMAATAGVSLSGTGGVNETMPVPRIPPQRDSGDQPPVQKLCEVERQAITQALEYTQGDRAFAAHLLGIGRTTLYRKLKEYQRGSGVAGIC